MCFLFLFLLSLSSGCTLFLYTLLLCLVLSCIWYKQTNARKKNQVIKSNRNKKLLFYNKWVCITIVYRILIGNKSVVCKNRSDWINVLHLNCVWLSLFFSVLFVQCCVCARRIWPLESVRIQLKYSDGIWCGSLISHNLIECYAPILQAILIHKLNYIQLSLQLKYTFNSF